MAIGEKVSLLIYLFSMFVSGFIISITHGWEMTLVVLAFMPVLVFSWHIMEKYLESKASYESGIFQSAGGIAQQALHSIKVVKQFNG
jgi:ATP-binding cassette subfamily B (MDR/TAP) protein 1